MKKYIHMICLSLLAIFLLPCNVFAYDYFDEILGEAMPRSDGFLHVIGVGLTDDSSDEVILNIYDAEIYDLQTGFAIDARDIYEGDTVRVVYNYDRALEIYVHAGEDNAADFMVTVSDNIWYSDDGCVFVTIDGKYRITLSIDTLLLDSCGYEINFEEIAPGMEMFVWAAFMTASFPGQVIPDKVVLR